MYVNNFVAKVVLLHYVELEPKSCCEDPSKLQTPVGALLCAQKNGRWLTLLAPCQSFSKNSGLAKTWSLLNITDAEIDK